MGGILKLKSIGTKFMCSMVCAFATMHVAAAQTSPFDINTYIAILSTRTPSSTPVQQEPTGTIEKDCANTVRFILGGLIGQTLAGDTDTIFKNIAETLASACFAPPIDPAELALPMCDPKIVKVPVFAPVVLVPPCQDELTAVGASAVALKMAEGDANLATFDVDYQTAVVNDLRRRLKELTDSLEEACHAGYANRNGAIENCMNVSNRFRYSVTITLARNALIEVMNALKLEQAELDRRVPLLNQANAALQRATVNDTAARNDLLACRARGLR